MPLSDQEFNKIIQQVELGSLYSMSPTLGKVGTAMVDRADKKLVVEQKNRNDLAAQKAEREDANTEWARRLGLTDANREARQDEANTEWRERQKIKDAEALKRAQTVAGKLSTTTREKRRESQMASQNVQHLIGLVDENPGAFGPLSDLTQYMGDSWPVFVTEGVKQFQQNYRSEEDTQTRATLYAQATDRIHDLAGAAQSVSEAARIARFVPDSNDSAKVIRGKLRSALDEAQRQNQSFDQEYGSDSDSNYPPPAMPKVVTETKPKQAAPKASGATAVGDPIELSDGTVWQEYADGTSEQVQ